MAYGRLGAKGRRRSGIDCVSVCGRRGAKAAKEIVQRLGKRRNPTKTEK